MTVFSRLPIARWAARVALGVALLAAAADLPNRWAYAQSLLPMVREWGNPDAQYRLQTEELPYPYDLLKQTDAALPPGTLVLLVTSGRDVGRVEYITYHRALYLLAPRPVWWLSPAPSDGSWKSRWWISAPLTPESVRNVAADRGATYALVYSVQEPLDIGLKVVEWSSGGLAHSYLLQLSESTSATTTPGQAARQTRQLHAGPGWPLQVTVATAIIMLLGGAVVRVAARFGCAFGRIEALSLAWALGAGLLSVLMLWLSAAGLHLEQQMIILALVALASAVWLLRMRNAKCGMRNVMATSNPTFRIPHSAFRTLLILFLLLQTVLVTISAAGRPLHIWDSWANWAVKARIIFLDGHISPAVYADPSRMVTHLDYPLFVPLMEAWFFGWLGAPDDRLVGVPSVLFYLSLVGITYAAAHSRGASRTLALAAAAVAGTISHVAGLAGIVFAELPLTLFAAIAAFYLLKWLDGGPPGALLIATLGAGLMPWTKREGLVLLLALCLGALLINFRRCRAWAGVGTLTLGAGLLAGPWWAFVAWNGIVNAAFLPINLPNLLANVYRWRTIVELEWNSLVSPGFSYIWPLAALASLFFFLDRTSHAPRSTLMLPVTAALYIALIGFFYIFSAFVPYEQHVLSSVDRLIVQVAPLAVLWLASWAAPPDNSEAIRIRNDE